MDIIYTDSIENKMNFTEDIILFKVENYYPIGLFIATNNNNFFNYLFTKAKEYYNPKKYQSVGRLLFDILFPTTETLLVNNNYKESIRICSGEYYLPWKWNQLDEFLLKKDNILPLNNVGIHWFNGASVSKTYVIALEKRLENEEFTIMNYLDKYVEKYIHFK